jgi:two-component system chemotaxis response regulator CheB
MADIAAKKTADTFKATSHPYRVLVVDDSAVIRGLLRKVLESDPAITVVNTVVNGQMALSAIQRQPVDVVVLDIEMPVMDGLTALPKLLELDPEVKVIMASTLTKRNADISLKALTLGAADYIPKPTSVGQIVGAFDFRRDLVEKVKALGGARRRGQGTAAPRVARAPAPTGRPTVPADKLSPGAKRRDGDGELTLRKASAVAPRVVAIGSSTGGPQALFEMLPNLSKEVTQPILITQHMPATFTAILADHIGKLTGKPCAEGADGEAVQPGHIYVAPGDHHMTVEATTKGKLLRLSQKPPENFCRPAVDPMLRSIAQAYGRHVLAVILTGMGQDGMEGGEAVVTAGGTVIAQDEATSVVWGMPGAAAAAGLCSAILPLEEIGPYVSKIATRSFG